MAKFCVNCGGELNETQELCLNCGALVDKKESSNKNGKSNIFAIIGFVLSLVSVFTFFVPFSFVLGVAALILSIIGLMKSVSLMSGKGFSIVGISVSILAIIISVFFTFLILIGIFATIEEEIMDSKCEEAFGDDYQAVESYSINDENDQDFWYCCIEDFYGEEATCIRL